MSDDKMREAFEAWYAKKFECDDIFGRYEVSGQYVGTSVEIAWLAWEASRNAQSEADVAPCPTCGGSRVDPGGLPVCRECTPAPVKPAKTEAKPVAWRHTHYETGSVTISTTKLDDLPYNRARFREEPLYAAPSAAVPADSGEAAIERSKRVLAAVDDYHECPSNDTRHALRSLLLDEFAALLAKRGGA